MQKRPDIGDPMPDVEMVGPGGTVLKPSDFRGRRLVIFLYPKDDTPGCTKEACGFRDLWSEIQAKAKLPTIGKTVDDAMGVVSRAYREGIGPQGIREALSTRARVRQRRLVTDLLERARGTVRELTATLDRSIALAMRSVFCMASTCGAVGGEGG